MHPIKNIYRAAAGLLALPALANGAPLCAPLESIKENTAFECKDNHYYGEAGLACLHAIEAAIQARAGVAVAQLAASNYAHVDQAGNAQTHNFQGSNGDYQISQDALTELIAQAKAARASVAAYKENIYYPEDVDAPEIITGPLPEFLDKNPCYAENRDGLKQVRDRMDSYIQQLEAAKAASLARANIAADRNGNQGNIDAQIVHGGTGVGSGVRGVPQGVSRNPASSITGVEQDAAKRAQAAGQ